MEVEMPNNNGTSSAIRVYDHDGVDDFPVLKAFQQYIDAEQEKSRKRLLSMGIFFFILMGLVVTVFVVLLINISNRNQQLNDRLVEYAMKERPQAPVVVQPPSTQDNLAVLKLTGKIEELQNKLAESQIKSQEAERAHQAQIAAAAEAAKKANTPSPEALEIQRLKAQLEEERKKAEEEKAKKKEAELDAYRRKHYPELYEDSPSPRRVKTPSKKKVAFEDERVDDNVDDILDDVDDLLLDRQRASKNSKVKPRKIEITLPDEDDDATDPTPGKAEPAKAPSSAVQSQKPEESYTIPVEVKGTSSAWRLP